MKAIAALYRALDASTSNLAKQAALQDYLRAAPPADAAWAVYFLAGGKPRQLVPTRVLREQGLQAEGFATEYGGEDDDGLPDAPTAQDLAGTGDPSAPGSSVSEESP